MNSAELLVIFLVAVVVFGPRKLPLLAEHLGRLIRYLNHFKEEASTFWHAQLNQQQLRENTSKAEKADRAYQRDVPE
jgi:sec-independent protein translocase protein TatB